MRAIGSDPVSTNATPSDHAEHTASDRHTNLPRHLDLRRARLARLPSNPNAPIDEQVIYEVRTTAQLAERILATPDEAFWLLGYTGDRPQPLEQKAQRLLHVSCQDRGMVVCEENGVKRECALGAGRPFLIRFLTDNVGDMHPLYLSVLQPSQQPSLRRQRSQGEASEQRRVRPRPEPTSLADRPALAERFERPDPGFRSVPSLTHEQRLTASCLRPVNDQRSRSAPTPSPAQVEALVAIAPEAFCRDVEDFALGFRALIIGCQSQQSRDLHERCEQQLEALNRQARGATRHWPFADFRLMTYLCNENRTNTRHHQALLVVLADMFTHHSSSLPAREMRYLANCLSHYRGNEQSEKGLAIKRAVTLLAQQYSTAGQAVNGPKDLSLLANCFSKWPATKACAAALSHIARDTVQRRVGVGDAELQSYANLAGAWSKCADDPDCAGALAKLARDVFRGHLKIDNATTQNLSMLANAWSKCFQDPDCARALAKLAHDVLTGRLQIDGATSQGIANLANAWSKCADDKDCADALAKLARSVLRGRLHIEANPQHIAVLANAWSKCAGDPDCAGALAKLARDVFRGHLKIDNATTQNLSMLANAWSKCFQDPDCARALAKLANDVLTGRQRIDGASPQDIANLANAWSKCADDPDCAGGLVILARDLLHNSLRIDDFKPTHLASLANVWSKCVDDPDCAGALAKLAREVLRGRLNIDGANAKELSKLANAWSKCPEDPDCLSAVARLARDLTQGRLKIDDAHPQDIGLLANAWSKYANSSDCTGALAKLACDVVRGRLQIGNADPQALANMAGAWAKHPDDPDCAGALAKLARGVRKGDLRIDTGDSQALAQLANAWSKCAEEDPDCAKALINMAGDFLHDRLRVDRAPLQNTALLANAWSKCNQDADCRVAINQVVTHALGPNGTAGDDFGIYEFALLANALGRNSRAATAADESEIAAQSHDHLLDLTLRLEETPEKFKTASTQNLAMLLCVLGQMGLRDERQRLTPVMLQRLEQLHKQTASFQDVSLETFGHLCIGLRPLALQRQRKQRALRGQVLQALDRLQPLVAQVLAKQTDAVDDHRQSRNPVKSVRHLFETYTVLANTLKARHLPRADDSRHTGKVLHARRQAIKQWLNTEEARLRPLFEGSNDVGLWDLQARIRAPEGGLGGSLDRLLAERASDWTAMQPPSVFNVHHVLASLDHPPRPPQGDAGIFQPPRINVRGRNLEQTGPARYHVLTHLTGGKLPYVVVELADKPTLSTLERPITYKEQSWRIDLVGGSRMKKAQVRAKKVMLGDGERPGGPQLMALRLSDTLPGSAYDDLARALMPAREDFFRFQRIFLSSPPSGIPALKPHDHVLQGTFRIGILPDRAGAHGFRFNDAHGRPIALQPHDGCGFVRQSLLERLPACQRAWGQDSNGNATRPLPAFATQDPGNLPGQALQHYSRSAAVAEEVQTRLASALTEQAPQSDRLFRTVATGLIQGHMAVVVPSADDRVHLSTTKAADFLQHGGGVLIGRSPYDKPNLRPLTEDRVATAQQGDPTAAFLDQCTTLQYSYVGDQPRAGGGKSALFASKGLMIGVPDELWPDPETDIVMSAQDIKTHSDWKTGKQRVTEDTLAHSKGLLVANEIFTPGSVIAMPRTEQQRLDGDFDGDTVVVVAGRPQLFEHVHRFDKSAPTPPVLKPPKTHSTPFDSNDDHYQHGRSREILPVYAGVMEQFSTLQTRTLAQPEAVREAIASRMLYGSFEGLPKGWKQQVRAVLEDEMVDTKRLGELHQALLEQQRSAPAHRAPARALEAELLNQLQALQRGRSAVLSTLPDTDEIPGIAALREDYQEARTPAERIEALLNCYPERQLSSRVGYEKPDDAQLCLQNLLSLGIKAGTDAYKSQTGVYEFSTLGRRLDRLLRSHGTVMEAPYTKGTASHLAAKRFDAARAQRELEDNPTLAASVMSAALAMPVVQKALQDQQPDNAPSASDRQKARQLASELQARAQASHGAVSAALEAVLRHTGAGKLFDREQECKGRGSILDKILLKHGQKFDDGLLSQAKNINDALRFHVELDEQQFTRQYRSIMETLDGNGVRRVRTVNCFNLGEQARYKGINVTRTLLLGGETVPFEIQFHSPQSRAMKKQCHALYKDATRRQIRHSDRQRVDQLEETMRERWRAVTAPPGVEGIGNSGGGWPTQGLWATLTTKALEDQPLDEEDESEPEDNA